MFMQSLMILVQHSHFYLDKKKIVKPITLF